jgi:hypothetical protein
VRHLLYVDQIGFIGISGIVLLLVLAILFFGVKRLPSVVRSARVGAKEFKDSAAGVSGLASTVPAEPAPLPPPVPAPPVPVPDAPEAE